MGGMATEPSISIMDLQTTSAVFLSTRFSRVYFVARSTSDTIASLCPFPMIVPASWLPIRFFLLALFANRIDTHHPIALARQNLGVESFSRTIR